MTTTAKTETLGLFSPLARQCLVAVAKVAKATDNGEAFNALKELYDVIVPWMKAMRPTEALHPVE